MTVTDAMTSQVIDAVLHAFHTGPASGRTNEEWNAAVQRRRAEVATVLHQIIADAVEAERAGCVAEVRDFKAGDVRCEVCGCWELVDHIARELQARAN